MRSYRVARFQSCSSPHGVRASPGNNGREILFGDVKIFDNLEFGKTNGQEGGLAPANAFDSGREMNRKRADEKDRVNGKVRRL